MKIGIEIPTCTPGMMYPVPFATVSEVVDTALEAEQLGYYDPGETTTSAPCGSSGTPGQTPQTISSR